MNRYLAQLSVWLLLGVSTAELFAQGPSAQSPEPLVAAKKTGWQLVQLVAEKLNGGPDFPGIDAWRKEFAEQTKGIDINVSPDKWPTVDMDALVTRNPNFWRAYYEIAPGDPGLAMIHAGLLLTAGDATRASQLIVIAGQRPGIPTELRRIFDVIGNNSNAVGEASNKLVHEGITFFDKGDYAAALAKHQEAIASWPQNSWAHYEYGLTLRQKQWKDSGEKLPVKGSVIVNSGPKTSPEVAAAFARARQHDPFQLKAYQGDDQEVIVGFMALGEKGLPAWEQIMKARQSQVTDDVLENLANALQDANQHELALVSRGILVARRNRYSPADHPFLTKSMQKLAPGKSTDLALERLAGGRLTFRQLIAPTK